MKSMSSFVLTLAASAALVSLAGVGHAQDGIDKAKAAAFDNKMFAGPIGQKTYACFVRRYDASHLAQHPKQKVSAMKLLVTAEIPPEEQHHQLFVPPRRPISPPARANSTPADPAATSSPKTRATKSALAAVSIATAAASTWR